MNIQKTTSILAISVAVMFTVATITGFQIAQITAEEDEEKGYTFAEGITVTGEFVFMEGIEVSQFEVFQQKDGFASSGKYVFELQKIVGETPLLHKLADNSYFLRNSPGEQKQGDNLFEVKVIISEGGDVKRTFSYATCYVSDYMVETLHDKEEGWNTSKGFAVTDIFEIQCSRYQPNNPVYVEMMSNTDKADTKSSLAYQEEQRHLFGKN